MVARIIHLTPDSRAAAVQDACAVLTAGGLIGMPTETVYGLAADAANGEAVARIFAAKGRPQFNPLICHVSGFEMAARYAAFNEQAERLAAEFWPGPLTLVVPLAEGSQVHLLATAGLPTVAIRAPQGLAADIIRAFGRAIAAPSANRSGRISATRAEHVVDQLGDRVALVVDAGPTRIGVESTIVSLTASEPILLRPGGVPTDAIEMLLGVALKRASSGDPVSAPGMLASHYAPSLPLRLDAAALRPGEALMAFGPVGMPGQENANAVRNLSRRGDLIEAAANLFAYLAELDRSGASAIAVMPVPSHGIGEAINDRLRRAAAPRD